MRWMMGDEMAGDTEGEGEGGMNWTIHVVQYCTKVHSTSTEFLGDSAQPTPLYVQYSATLTAGNDGGDGIC